MAYDLAISDYGDLLLAGNRDLAGVSGPNLTDQRIAIRLTVHRGTWFYDDDGTFGSELYQVVGKPAENSLDIDALVRNALAPMEEISIEDINWEYDEGTKAVVVQVSYLVIESGEGYIDQPGGITQDTTVTIPFTFGEV